jgi:hypothetical protein
MAEPLIAGREGLAPALFMAAITGLCTLAAGALPFIFALPATVFLVFILPGAAWAPCLLPRTPLPTVSTGLAVLAASLGLVMLLSVLLDLLPGGLTRPTVAVGVGIMSVSGVATSWLLRRATMAAYWSQLQTALESVPWGASAFGGPAICIVVSASLFIAAIGLATRSAESPSQASEVVSLFALPGAGARDGDIRVGLATNSPRKTSYLLTVLGTRSPRAIRVELVGGHPLTWTFEAVPGHSLRVVLRSQSGRPLRSVLIRSDGQRSRVGSGP